MVRTRPVPALSTPRCSWHGRFAACGIDFAGEHGEHRRVGLRRLHVEGIGRWPAFSGGPDRPAEPLPGAAVDVIENFRECRDAFGTIGGADFADEAALA